LGLVGIACQTFHHCQPLRVRTRGRLSSGT
jgi:hypothetical protein